MTLYHLISSSFNVPLTSTYCSSLFILIYLIWSLHQPDSDKESQCDSALACCVISLQLRAYDRHIEWIYPTYRTIKDAINGRKSTKMEFRAMEWTSIWAPYMLHWYLINDFFHCIIQPPWPRFMEPDDVDKHIFCCNDCTLASGCKELLFYFILVKK